MTTRRQAGAVMILVGTAAFTACLWSVATGMRDVMRVDGGFCASGGPYVVAHQCSGGDIRLLMVGIFGGLLSAALYAGGSSALGRPASSAGLIAWSAMFGVLGWNFINQYLHPVAGQSGSIGFLIPGILFEVMAVGGLIPLIGGIKDDLRRGNRPDDSFARVSGPPIVRAVVPSGFVSTQQLAYDNWSPGAMNGSLADAVPQPKLTLPLANLGIWLATSAVGAVIGLVLSSSLINVLK